MDFKLKSNVLIHMVIHMEVEKMGVASISGAARSTNYQSEAASQTTSAVQDTASYASAGTDRDIAGTDAVVMKNAVKSSGNTSMEAKKRDEEATAEKLKEIRKMINGNTIAEFGYNEPTKRITIKIKDKDTDKVIKEIPSEELLDIIAKTWELAGILVDKKL